MLTAACATTHPPPTAIATPAPAPVAAPPAPLAAAPPPRQDLAAVAELKDLPGWADEDHAAALGAYRATCDAFNDSARAPICARARALGRVDDAAARRFLEANFRAEMVTGDGLLTAYFAPEYEARRRPDAEFSAPVRPRPADLYVIDGSQSYPDRTAIESRPPSGALAWMRPEDLFFLQIQGSGSLTFPDGQRLRAVYDSNNGQRFRGIAAPMREQGLLEDSNTSGEAIRAWLAAHRGPEAEAVMRLNPRYVFYRLAPDDGTQPPGADGLPLPPGRAIAVDLTRHGLGELFWIDARAPALSGAFPTYQRMAVALDTGGAIRGDVRADLYLGRGPAAGVEAGRVRHTLRLYRLVPIDR
jgi:membrane-bound lytic murein transglycosylase A